MQSSFKRKPIVLLLLVCALVLFTSSCSNEVKSVGRNGTLLIKLGSHNSKGIQAVSMAIASYNLAIKDSNNNTVLDVLGIVDDTYEVSVPEDSYFVIVDALNEDEISIGRGTSSVSVKAGKTITANIVIQELEGLGNIFFTIQPEKRMDLIYSILNIDGIEIETDYLDYSQGLYSGSASLNEGFYVFLIKNDEIVIDADSVRIIAGRDVEYEAKYILRDGSGPVIQSINSSRPDIELNCLRTELFVNEIVTVSASVTGLTSFEYQWVVDDVYGEYVKSTDGVVTDYNALWNEEGFHTIALALKENDNYWFDFIPICIV